MLKIVNMPKCYVKKIREILENLFQMVRKPPEAFPFQNSNAPPNSSMSAPVADRTCERRAYG